MQTFGVVPGTDSEVSRKHRPLFRRHSCFTVCISETSVFAPGTDSPISDSPIYDKMEPILFG